MIKSCKTCDRDPCEGHHKEFCKFHPDNRQTNFGPSPPHWWKKKRAGIVVTPVMIEDLLHRNDVDIKHAEKKIERMHKDIEEQEELVKQLLKVRVGLFEALEGVE